jgi:FRG domain
MSGSARIDSYGGFQDIIKRYDGVVYRGQSREYPGITPSLFRLSEPLDALALAAAAKDLYFSAYRVTKRINTAYESGAISKVGLWALEKLRLNRVLEKEVEAGDDDLTYDDLIENGVRFVKKNKFDDGFFFKSDDAHGSTRAQLEEYLAYKHLNRDNTAYTIGDFDPDVRKKAWKFFARKNTDPTPKRPSDWVSPFMPVMSGSQAGTAEQLKDKVNKVKATQLEIAQMLRDKQFSGEVAQRLREEQLALEISERKLEEQLESEAAQRKLKDFAILKYIYRNSEHFPIALLQHYGVPTTALDVTFNPLIALWFACHRFVPSIPAKGNVRFSPATYEKNPDEGVVYLMKPSGREYEVEDLRRGRNLPIAGLRGARQSGGLLLGATKQKQDLSDLVVFKVYARPGTFNTYVAPFSEYNQELLFPSPREDHFYRDLLAAKRSGDASKQRLANFIVIYK